MAKNYVTISDGYFYKIPSTPKIPPAKYKEVTYGKGEPVSGDLVYIRYKNTFTPMIKLSKGATPDFRYINANTVQEKTSSFSNADTVMDLHNPLVDYDLNSARGDSRSFFNGGDVDTFNGGDDFAFCGDTMSSATGTTDGKVEYTTAELTALKEKSGDKKTPLKDWVNSGKAANLLNSIGGFAQTITQAQQQLGAQPYSSGATLPPPPSDDDGEKKILGMHPITFSIVSISVLLVGALLINQVLKKKAASVVPVKVKA